MSSNSRWIINSMAKSKWTKISNLRRRVLDLFVLPLEGVVNVALRKYEANRY